MTTSNTQDRLLKAADKLRSKAEQFRKRKTEHATGAATSLLNVGTTVGTYLEKRAQVTLALANGVNTICSEIVNNAQLQQQVITLVANTIDNLASRANEVANIIESVAKSPKMQEAFVKTAEAMKDFGAMAEDAKKSALNKKKKFSVVPNAFDDSTSGTTTKKSAHRPKKKKS